MSKPPQLRIPDSLRRRALMFVLPVLLGMGLLIVAISYRQGAFERYDMVTFSVDSAAGISRGMPVKLKGLMIGQVSEMNPVSADHGGSLGIVVTLVLNQRHTGIIPSDSKVTLSQEGLIGQSFIEVLPGKASRVVASGESLEYLKRRGLKDIIESASSEAVPILHDVRSFSRTLADPEGEFQVGIRNTVALTREFPEMSRQTLATVRATREMVDGVKVRSVAVLDAAEKEMPAVMEKVGETLDNVKASSQTIRQLAQELRTPILGIVEDGRHSSAEARQIIGSAKQSWPLNAILPRPAHESVLPDSAADPAILQPRPIP